MKRQKTSSTIMRNNKELQCGYPYCNDYFDSKSELKTHQIAAHKAKLKDSPKMLHPGEESKKKYKPVMETIKSIFTSGTKKVKESPPVCSLKLDCYQRSPRQTNILFDGSSNSDQNSNEPADPASPLSSFHAKPNLQKVKSSDYSAEVQREESTTPRTRPTKII